MMVSIAKMREQLLEGFPEPQADLMARVFVSAHDELVTKAELNELTAVMRDLAEIQGRTDEKMGALAEAVKRTDDEVGSLAAAQRRTEWAVKDLAKQVGGLSAAVGGSLEDFACDLVPELLEKYWAMVIESAGPEDVTVGDEPREFDVVVRGRIEGRPLAVICETKATVSVKEVKRFLRLVGRLKEARPTDDIRPLFFGYKAERRARDLIVASGAAMVFTRGVMIPLPPGSPATP
jgi:hypothetical protein